MPFPFKTVKGGEELYTIDRDIVDIQITDESGNTHSFIDEHNVINKNNGIFSLGFNYDTNEDGTLRDDIHDVQVFSFNYPEGETQESMLKKLQASKLKLVSGPREDLNG